MKHLKIALLALLLIVSYSNANAQDKENPWMLNAGTNLIDIVDGESGNIIPWLSKISVSRFLGSGFSLELSFKSKTYFFVYLCDFHDKCLYLYLISDIIKLCMNDNNIIKMHFL